MIHNDLQTMLAASFLLLCAIYLLLGLAFAIPFVLAGVAKVDPHAAHGTWGFRLLVLPGSVFFWPLLACRWLGKRRNPPEERNAHRLAARKHL